jgi:hypothetical protein
MTWRETQMVIPGTQKQVVAVVLSTKVNVNADIVPI